MLLTYNTEGDLIHPPLARHTLCSRSQGLRPSPKTKKRREKEVHGRRGGPTYSLPKEMEGGERRKPTKENRATSKIPTHPLFFFVKLGGMGEVKEGSFQPCTFALTLLLYPALTTLIIITLFFPLVRRRAPLSSLPAFSLLSAHPFFPVITLSCLENNVFFFFFGEEPELLLSSSLLCLNQHRLVKLQTLQDKEERLV